MAWTGKRLPSGATVDELLRVDGVPLWWVFERFVRQSLLPKPLAPFGGICEAFAEGSRPFPSLWRVLLLREPLLLNERLKWRGKKPVPYLSLSRPPVVFLTYAHYIFTEHGKARLYRIEPVVERLQRTGVEPLVLTVHSLSRHGGTLAFPTIYDFLQPLIKKKAASSATQLTHAWRRVATKEREHLLRVGDRSLYPYLRGHLSLLFSWQFLYIFLVYYLTIKEIAVRNHVRAFYLTSSVGLFEKCCLLAGNVLGIPVFVAQHGSGVGFGKIRKELLVPVTFLVFGRKHKEKLLAMGVPGSNIVVTGSPMADEIARLPAKKSSELQHALVLTQPFVEDALWSEGQRRRFFAVLKQVMNKLPQVAFVIKPHPREKRLLYEKAFDGVRVSDAPLYEELTRADLVFGVNSTALMEALLLNRPVIVLDLFRQAGQESHVCAGLSLRVAHAGEFDQRVSSYLAFYRSRTFDLLRKHYIEDFFFRIDGKAAERIVQVITARS